MTQTLEGHFYCPTCYEKDISLSINPTSGSSKGKICISTPCGPIPAGIQINFGSCSGTPNLGGCIECDNMPPTTATITVTAGGGGLKGGSGEFTPPICGDWVVATPGSYVGSNVTYIDLGLHLTDGGGSSSGCDCPPAYRLSGSNMTSCPTPLKKSLQLSDPTANVNVTLSWTDSNPIFGTFLGGSGGGGWIGTATAGQKGCGKTKQCPAFYQGMNVCLDCGCPTGGGDVTYAYGMLYTGRFLGLVCGVFVSWWVKSGSTCRMCPVSKNTPGAALTGFGILPTIITGCPGNGWTATARMSGGSCGPLENNWYSGTSIWAKGNDLCCPTSDVIIVITE